MPDGCADAKHFANHPARSGDARWLLGGETFSLSFLLGTALALAGVRMIFRKAKIGEPTMERERKAIQLPES